MNMFEFCFYVVKYFFFGVICIIDGIGLIVWWLIFVRFWCSLIWLGIFWVGLLMVIFFIILFVVRILLMFKGCFLLWMKGEFSFVRRVWNIISCNYVEKRRLRFLCVGVLVILLFVSSVC